MGRRLSDWDAERRRRDLAEPEKPVRRRYRRMAAGVPKIVHMTEEEIERCIQHMASVIPPVPSRGMSSSLGNAMGSSTEDDEISDPPSLSLETGGR